MLQKHEGEGGCESWKVELKTMQIHFIGMIKNKEVKSFRLDILKKIV